mgnify:CR=1 FL=1
MRKSEGNENASEALHSSRECGSDIWKGGGGGSARRDGASVACERRWGDMDMATGSEYV